MKFFHLLSVTLLLKMGFVTHIIVGTLHMACMMKCWMLEAGGMGVGAKAVVSHGCKTIGVVATSLFFHSYDYWHFTTRTCMCVSINKRSLSSSTT